MAKVSSVDNSVTELNSKLDQKVSRLDSKLDAMLQSLSQKSGPSTTEREAHLDQLISIRLKNTVEQIDSKYDALVDNYLNTISSMLKVHDDLVSATNKLIK